MRPERAYSPAARATDAPDPWRVLVIGCGALARELVAVIDQAGLTNVDLTCLPATLHNRPGGIPAAVRDKIRAARPRYKRIFIAYADCGTGGLLDNVLAEEDVERLPGAHCYEFFSGSAAFSAMTDVDLATFFLTDFLARNFDRLVVEGLGLDRHPELLPTYFGNYHRLVYLAQTDDPLLVAAARRASRRLGLAFEVRRTGYGDLATSVIGAADQAAAARVAHGEAAGPSAARHSTEPGSVAAGASNALMRRERMPAVTDSLQPGQQIVPTAHGQAPGLPLQQERRASRSRSRRSLPPQQRSRGFLRVPHESAADAPKSGST